MTFYSWWLTLKPLILVCSRNGHLDADFIVAVSRGALGVVGGGESHCMSGNVVNNCLKEVVTSSTLMNAGPWSVILRHGKNPAADLGSGCPH
jgi:hypothetical protein